MINNPELEQILETMDDPAVVVELYPSDYEPPFDPADALFRYSAINVGFLGEDYQRLIERFGRIKRSISEESNFAETDFSNFENAMSDYELTTGYEGLIKVVRYFSRGQSDDVSKSLILFSGRCEKAESGTKKSLSLKGEQIISYSDGEIPRRKFSYEDAEGRPFQDKNFEGFRYIPQYGVTTYSVRQRRGGLLGLLGFKKTVTKNLQYSSFSDLDADKYLPVVFGRVQLMGTHISYADVGTTIRMATAFCEGKIESFEQWRSDDARYTFLSLIHRRLGYPADQGPAVNPGGIFTQQPIPGITFPGNGYYANTAMLFSEVRGTNILQVDEAPGVYVRVLGTLVTVPDSDGEWTLTDKFSDNAAAHTRFVLTSNYYYKLSAGWINDESFYRAHRYNDEIIFDASYSDLIFVPDSPSFEGGDKEKGKFLASTGLCSPKYFKYLNGDATASEAFLQTPLAETYSESLIPIEPPPPEPGEIPGGTTNNLTFFLRRRYTCNVVVSEQTKLVDFLYKTIFPSSRMFLSQDEQGRIKLNHKKPVDWCLATEAITGTSFAVDDVSAFVADSSRFLLIDPHTANAEVRIIDAANYTGGKPGLSGSENLTISAFSGGNSADLPMSATVEVDSVVVGGITTLTFDEAEFAFTTGTGDTVETAAGFLYGAINGHPILKRKYRASWSAGTGEVLITYLSGTIFLTAAVENSHAAPIADPPYAPVVSGASGGFFDAGIYRACYSYVNDRGETLISPVAEFTLTANQKVDFSAESLPSGASSIRWYMSPAKDSLKLRFVKENDGSAFSVLQPPKLTATTIPDFNRTGAEVMRVQAVFSDRAESVSSISRSNVLKATYKWRLANKDKSINEVALKFRDSTQDFRLIELRLKDDANIAKIKKINRLEVNGQAIDNYNQSYRVAAAILAEKLDADFFYEWQSDRKALLLEEGDVVAITDAGSGVINFPVRIESNDYEIDSGFVKVSFTARKYSTTLYDDSVRERQIPVIIEQSADFTPEFV